jgi:hypothetical protein
MLKKLRIQTRYTAAVIRRMIFARMHYATQEVALPQSKDVAGFGHNLVMAGACNEIYVVFWFAFAVRAMGGLIFSLVAIIFYLPLFLKIENRS